MRILVPIQRQGTPSEEGAALTLNGVGMRVWQLCDGRNVDQIVATIVAEYDVDAMTALKDVVTMLDELRQAQALEP